MKSIKTLFKIGHGPSSSHTMGPGFASERVKKMYPNHSFVVTLYNSLALTGEGHLTNEVIKSILKDVSFKAALDPNEHPNLLIFEVYKDNQKKDTIEVVSLGGGDIAFNNEISKEKVLYPHKSFDQIRNYCKENKISLVDYIKKYDTEDLFPYLEKVYDQMIKTINKGIKQKGLLPGELKVARKAHKLYESAIKQEDVNLKNRTLLSTYAFSVSEENAAGGIVVTAPTCGASGILPAVLYYADNINKIERKKIINALAIAGLFGNIIRKNATISGAVGGCQAEVGSACSMAAAAYAYLKGESIDQIEYAAEIAMEHHLGLTCDPVMGYVQIPCIERNAVAALRAINASELALILFETRKISFDMIVKTMYQTGLDMDPKYKETSKAGMATIYKELEKKAV